MLKFRIRKFVAEALQIRVPFQFADAEAEPIRERSHRLNRRKLPILSGRHRLHALRLGDPFSDGNLRAVLRGGMPETRIFANELNHLPMARPGSSGERLDVATSQGFQPAPVSAECSNGACVR